jgi:nuclear pore complex protein Nup155
VHYLYEIILQIFFISDHSGPRSQSIVENCWEEIIRKSSQIGFSTLCDKITELGLRFYPDDSVFPVKFLISKLEQLALEQNEKQVRKVFLDVKISYSTVFEMYHELWEMKLPPWSSSKSLTFLVKELVGLVQEWLEHVKSPSVGIYERDEFQARVIDEALSKYLVSVSVEEKALIQMLHQVQARVRSAF